MSTKTVDVALIGGGIMSATLGTLIKLVQPDLSIEIIEARGSVATESSNPWNNAGTGHAALCELNYMPESKDGGPLSADRAIGINEQFQLSREWWSFLVEQGVLKDPPSFINPTPHMTFVEGEKNVDYLRRRYEVLKNEPLFAGMEFSDDPDKIAEWAPLLIKGRASGTPYAATRITSGTDVNFGAVTAQLVDYLVNNGATLRVNTRVRSLRRNSSGGWDLRLRRRGGRGGDTLSAKFVFVGGGGGALPLLQSAKIPEIKGYGGFPISGKFLRCDNPEIVQQHQAKVYGKAKVGAPPMSVPHLDTRVVDGKTSLMFGPFAGFTPKFLKRGSWLDLPGSVRLHNLWPMIRVGLSEFALVKYLITELLASRDAQIAALRDYYPEAKAEDWKMITAGQRVQVMKKDPEKGGVLQFGTEVITSKDGTISGLLGASPGASTAVVAMLGVLEKCFPEKFTSSWKAEFEKQIPSYGKGLNHDADAARKSLDRTAKILKLSR